MHRKIITESFLIFVETSQEEYSSKSRYIHIEGVPEKSITVERRASGISEGDISFLLQAEQLSSDLGHW